jgi:predicted phage tail protein
MTALTNIKLHGILGEAVGKESWNLAVSSVGEAMRAIEIMSKRKLNKFLYDNDRNGVKYQVLVNGREVNTKGIDKDDLESIRNSELNLNFGRLDSVDIIPVIQGAGKGGSIASIIVGVILVIVGAFLIATGIGVPMIIAGIGLIAGGVINLLSQPPKFEDFREIGGGKRASYLFNGPENTTREGGPVPVGYGRLIVGSQVLSASYEISHVSADDNPLTT